MLNNTMLNNTTVPEQKKRNSFACKCSSVHWKFVYSTTTRTCNEIKESECGKRKRDHGDKTKAAVVRSDSAESIRSEHSKCSGYKRRKDTCQEASSQIDSRSQEMSVWVLEKIEASPISPQGDSSFANIHMERRPRTNLEIIRSAMRMPNAPKRICRGYFERALHGYLQGEFAGYRNELSRRFTILVSIRKQITTASVEVVTLLGVFLVTFDRLFPFGSSTVDCTSESKDDRIESDSDCDELDDITSDAVRRALLIDPSKVTDEKIQQARMLATIFTQRLHQLGYCPAAANFKKGHSCATSGEYADLRKCCIGAAKRQLPLLLKTYGVPEVLSV